MIFIKEKYGRRTDPNLKKAIDAVYKDFSKKKVKNIAFESSLTLVLNFADTLYHDRKVLSDSRIKEHMQESYNQLQIIEDDIKKRLKDVKHLSFKQLITYDINNIAFPDKVKLYVAGIYGMALMRKSKNEAKAIMNGIIKAAREMRSLYSKYEKYKNNLTEGLKDIFIKIISGIGKIIKIILTPVVKLVLKMLKGLVILIAPFAKVINKIITTLGLEQLPPALDIMSSFAMSIGFTFLAIPLIGLSQAINISYNVTSYIITGADFLKHGSDIMQLIAG